MDVVDKHDYSTTPTNMQMVHLGLTRRELELLLAGVKMEIAYIQHILDSVHFSSRVVLGMDELTAEYCKLQLILETL